ncbi:MAG: hypothetical protein ACK5LK_02240 [Chthoniobacterales bacterium]
MVKLGKLFRKRPWLILILVNAIFMAWWISFIVFAVKNQPEVIEIEEVPAQHDQP